MQILPHIQITITHCFFLAKTESLLASEQTQNLAKHLRYSFLAKTVKNEKLFTIFAKTSILDV